MAIAGGVLSGAGRAYGRDVKDFAVSTALTLGTGGLYFGYQGLKFWTGVLNEAAEGYRVDGVPGATANALNVINPLYHFGVGIAGVVVSVENGDYEAAGEHGFDVTKIVAMAVVGGVKGGERLLAEGGGTVYRSVSAAGQTQYVGITNNLARRAAEHLSGRGIQIEKLMGGLSRSDARAVEQAMIEIHGLERSGGTLLNRINSIAPMNPTYSQQLQRGYELLQSIGYR